MTRDAKPIGATPSRAARRWGADEVESVTLAQVGRDARRVVWETRWMSLYVFFLMLGVTMLVGGLYWVIPSPVVWRRVAEVALAVYFGYASSVWLRAAANNFRGHKVLHSGCFQAPWRQFASASWLFGCSYWVPEWFLPPTSPLQFPLRALLNVVLLLALPCLILGAQSISRSIRSGFRMARLRPSLVTVVVVTTGFVNVAADWLNSFLNQQATRAIMATGVDSGHPWTDELLRSPVTMVVLGMICAGVKCLGLMTAGPASFCLYWRLNGTRRRL